MRHDSFPPADRFSHDTSCHAGNPSCTAYTQSNCGGRFSYREHAKKHVDKICPGEIAIRVGEGEGGRRARTNGSLGPGELSGGGSEGGKKNEYRR